MNESSVVLIHVEDDEPLGLLTRNLTAQFAADGTAAAGDKHCFPFQVAADLVGVDHHLVPAQQILHLHIADLLDIHLTTDQI